ncbi:MAG: hypothetical protein JNM00_12165, partial [Flavobacteriales bacterium]|nr:hypothetical protein [Flavobacteriales bacterium]
MKNKFTSTIILFMTMAIFAPFVRAQCPGNQIGVNFSITNYDQGISALFPDATINYLIVSSSNVVVSSGSLSSGQDLDLDLCLDQGCYTVTVTGMACEFSGGSFFPTCDNWLMTAGTTELDGSSGISNSTTHTVCVISGCTDIDACNYNQIASIDDGSCTGTKGCTDPLACNFHAWASCESGACCYDNTCFEFTLTSLNGLSLDLMGWKVIGNGSLTRVGRGPASTTATDHLCIVPAIYSIQIIDNNGAEVDIELGDLAGGEILYESSNYIEFAYGMNVGCQNPEACNYDPLAEISVECKFPGCTDPSACNYSENAGCDDGSCITEGMQTVHISASNGTGLTIFDDQGNEIDSFNFFIGASMDICLPFGCYSLNGSIGNCITGFGITLCKSITVSVNGIELAHLVLGNNNADICIEHGCLDPLACNFDPEATLADGSCLYTTGCTDPSKSNYDPLALCDDGSCIGGIFGCTDPVACNYKPLATQDDGSCDITSTKVHINIQNFNTGAANPIVL